MRYYKFFESYPGKKLPHAITTMGVLMGLIDNIDAEALSATGNFPFSRWDRNGEALDVNLGFDGFKYRFAGKSVTVYTSTYCEPGYWYGLNLSKGNLKRYVPPALPGAQGDSRIGNEVEFIAPWGGSNSIFMPALFGDRATDFVQAPFIREFQILPDDPVSMKLSGITELTVT